jgi:serine/threonine-protein kinase
MMPQPEPDPRLGSDVAGYRIESRIGRGGMGVVYLAEHQTLRRQAALKIIVPELAESPDFRERFLREARIAATMTHPNVVTVYDAGDIDGLLYIAMQYVPGRDLSQILRDERRLGPYRVLDIGRQVGAALDTAHAHGLIHRDVKPANVLIDGRHAYLTDFGLTKERATSEAGLTRVGEVVGTTHYLAPEQVEGRDVDGRADVYALGCLIFHCLTGEVPFTRDNDMAVLYAHLHDDPPKLSERRKGLPEGLDAVIAKALDKSPDRRFSTCDELIAAARAVVDAAGPLSESSSSGRTPSSPRIVPPSGDAPSLPTDTREVPPTGDSSSVYTLTGVTGPGGRRAIVLLAGVDANARAIVKVAIGNRCEVLEGRTLEEVLQIARERRPDVVLVDPSSADAPAAAVTRALREDAVTRDAKVVVLGASRDTGRRQIASLGADDGLSVPFSPLQLQVKLRKLLGSGAVSG